MRSIANDGDASRWGECRRQPCRIAPLRG